jgi:menaquinone-9 beta-reductase
MPDALVVGAGPAGLSAALALRRAGADVIVFEQHPLPPPRVCGAFVNPEGVGHLHALDLADRVSEAGAVSVNESQVSWPGGDPTTVPIVSGDHAGLALPRPALERLMADAFEAAGGRVQWGARVTAAERGRDGWTVDVVTGVHRQAVGAPLLVVADGRFSTLSGRTPRKARVGWFGWNASFVGAAQPPGALSLHFHAGGYVGVLTFADGVSNVCGLVKLDGTRPPRWQDVFATAVREQPALARLLRTATRLEPFRGVGPLPFSLGMVERPGALLAGDAAAVGDPYMGEGISRALGTGPALLAALDGGRLATPPDACLARYNRVWRGRYLPRLRLGTVARWIFGSPRLAPPVLGQVLSRPAFLRRILAVAHGGAGEGRRVAEGGRD